MRSLRRLRVLVATALSVALIGTIAAGSALAIKHGTPDGEGHPYVGLMIAQDANGNPMWRCSGTLISPTLYLTAGHCTSGASHVEIWFASDVDAGRPGNGYPFTGEVGGTPYTHPQYTDAAFYLYDLGVVVLDEPVHMATYGVLPSLDQLDTLKTRRGLKDVTFRAVGYGLQQSFPTAASFLANNQRVRMVAYPKLQAINVPGFTGDFSLLLSNNAATGGTCFGDSGGPNFLGTSNVIAGVTSFGMNITCSGTGGVYRVDRADDLGWLHGSFGAHLH
jgi:secreted trypsin-like serine protease